MSYAVIDFETTGILPSYHHRVVEVGIVHVEPDGEISGRWETLINPQRDLGPQGIHRIRASDILSAPTFSDIAPDFARLLRGRTVVAHNVPFDLRFLHAEFERAGYLLPPVVPTVCTMSLGARFGLGGSMSLVNACQHFGIEHPSAHSASGDAFAAAQLLAEYRRQSATWPGWADYWEQTTAPGRVYPYPVGQSTGAAWCGRSDVEAPIHFLERIANESDRPAGEGASAEYLALLDRCLLDGCVSVSEGAQLAEVAGMLGLDRAAVDSLHSDYYRALLRAAWADGVLTEDERAELDAVAQLLRIPDDEQVQGSPSKGTSAGSAAGSEDGPADGVIDRFVLQSGDTIVLTGVMSRERSEWETELHARGFLTHPTVTKKVALLVAADPDSLSGKARKARDYGIPIVSEEGLLHLLTRTYKQ